MKFYGDEASLFTTVATCLGQGFIDGHPAIVIATPEHTAPILEHLKGRMIGVDQLDGRATLSWMPGRHSTFSWKTTCRTRTSSRTR